MSARGLVASRASTALAVLALLGLLGLQAGCGPAVMVAQAPPPGWQASILADRAARDREFALAPDSPIPASRRGTFRGLAYWRVDPRYRLVGPLQRHADPAPFTIVTTAGKARPCERYGALRFELGGATLALQVYRLLDAPSRTGGVEDLFVPFMDATTGRETYPAGRYVELEQQGPDRYVLDFNRAYNPLCAYGSPERFQCPRTPAENRLPIAVEAGERGWEEEGGRRAGG